MTNMSKKIFRGLIVVQILFACFVFKVSAFSDVEAGAYLWKLINEARARPAKAIEIYGIEYDKAREALGDDSWILELENGLYPLAWNQTLADTSNAHSSDMINRQYYSYTSPEGGSFADRIINSGYNPKFSGDTPITGETLGILSFYIYVSPKKAVEGLFKNMLKDELNPSLGYRKNIFSKEFTEIGISFVSTSFSLDDGTTFYGYIVTADFSKPAEARSFILGNVYNIGENQPTKSEWDKFVPKDDTGYAEKLLSYSNSSWPPDRATGDFTIWANNITDNWSREVTKGALGTYQIEIPANTFYSLELFSGSNPDFFEKIVNLGTGINKMIDLGLN